MFSGSVGAAPEDMKLSQLAGKAMEALDG